VQRSALREIPEDQSGPLSRQSRPLRQETREDLRREEPRLEEELVCKRRFREALQEILSEQAEEALAEKEAKADAGARVRSLQQLSVSQDAELRAASCEQGALEAAIAEQRSKVLALEGRLQRQEQRVRQLQKDRAERKQAFASGQAGFSFSDASAELSAALQELGFADASLKGHKEQSASTGLLLQASMLDAAAHFLRGELECLAETRDSGRLSTLALLKELRARRSLGRARPTELRVGRG